MRLTVAHLRAAMLAVGTALLLACASGPEISRDINPAANFPGYKTFGFFAPLATDRPGYETIFTARLKGATRRAMEARGYVYRETDPELLVNFFANVQEREEVLLTPAPLGYYDYRRGYGYGYGYGYYGSWWGPTRIDTIRYREGTLTIDLVEARRKILVWQATAVGGVSNEVRASPGPAIDAVVTQMMAPLAAVVP